MIQEAGVGDRQLCPRHANGELVMGPCTCGVGGGYRGRRAETGASDEGGGDGNGMSFPESLGGDLNSRGCTPM